MFAGWVRDIFGCRRPVLAALHLSPLPGAPRYAGRLEKVIAAACREARVLADAGVHGLVIENFGDAPFFKTVPACTVAAMTAVAVEVRRAAGLPFGLNVLRNDAEAALAIAAATGAAFIRVNVLSGARLTDQGVIEGPAATLLRERDRLRSGKIRILADVDVKHSAPLARRPLLEEAEELVNRAGADALIVTGSGTGKAAQKEDLLALRKIRAPLLVGSGVTPGNLGEYSGADGFIVGSCLRRAGLAGNPVDLRRARVFMKSWKNSPGR